jgi:hypothetical protein
MAGIGIAVGSLVGLGVMGLKHFKLWPFNNVGQDDEESDDEGNDREDDEGQEEDDENDPPEMRLCRRHPRSWKMEKAAKKKRRFH